MRRSGAGDTFGCRVRVGDLGWCDRSNFAPADLSPAAAGDRVAVLAPTTGARAKYHAALYASFACQAYENRELVVVDTGAEPSPFFKACADPRVTYVHVKGGNALLTIGDKRNRAIAELTAAPIIANFDDDDLYGPTYLDVMVAALVREKAGLAKLERWYNFDVETGIAGCFDAQNPKDAPPHIVATERESRGFGFVYTRSAFAAVPWKDTSWGEDANWVPRAKAAGVQVAYVSDVDGVMVHVQHGGNVACTICTEEADRGFLLEGPAGALVRSHLPAPSSGAPARGVYVFTDGSDVEAWAARVVDYDANRAAIAGIGEDALRPPLDAFPDAEKRARERSRVVAADRGWRGRWSSPGS